ncbi:MAG TPA: diguanylate cyclase [Armatimonadota bacterium]|nr:diguanylate cyclase [Armatimonadota bacterium]
MSSQSPYLDEASPLTASLALAANAIAGATLTIRDEGPLLDMVLTRLSEVMRPRAGAIFMHDGEQFTIAAHLHGRGQDPSRLAGLTPLIERLLPEIGGAAQRLGSDAALESGETRDGGSGTPGAADMQGLLLIPLVTRGAPMGAIALDLPAAPAPLVAETLRLIGYLLASALRERRLQARLDLAHRKLDERGDWQGHDEYTDALTGLANAAYFDLELERVVSEGVQTGGNVSLLRIEIDRYKAVCEAYGISFASNVVRQVAQTLTHSIRGRDVAVRLSDDLFFVLLPVTPGIGAVVVAERLRDRLSGLSFEVPEGSWHLTASVGVACLSNRVVSADELLAKSQRCLLQSKALGGNQVFFDWDEALETTGEQ